MSAERPIDGFCLPAFVNAPRSGEYFSTRPGLLK